MNRVPQCLLMIVPVWLFAACVATSDVTPLLPSDDCGPRPDNYKAIAAAWLNAHCHYSPPNPIKAQELTTTAPTRIATVDAMHGRNAGWQIILGPQNKAVCDFADAKYTRMIVNRGRVISVTSEDQLAALLPPPPPKAKVKVKR